MLLVILILGLVGTGTELVLLQHYQNGWQAVPLALIGLALASLIWHGASIGTASVRALQALMALFLFSGLIGVGLHLNVNAEFELEKDSSLAGYRLFKESLSGATLALAPGSMVQLGLIGLVFTYRHPRLSPGDAAVRRQE